MDLREMVDQVKNNLDAGEIDSEIALISHDRPEPADLSRLIAFVQAVMSRLDQTQRLIAQHSRRDRQLPGGEVPE